MKVGKFEIAPIYDMQCGKCGNFRYNLWPGNIIHHKPTVKMLKEEGWTIEKIKIENEEVEIQVCPHCNRGEQ